MKKVMSDRLRQLLQDPKAAEDLRRKIRDSARQESFMIVYDAKEDEAERRITLRLARGL